MIFRVNRIKILNRFLYGYCNKDNNYCIIVGNLRRLFLIFFSFVLLHFCCAVAQVGAMRSKFFFHG